MTGPLLGKERSITPDLLCLRHFVQERAEAQCYFVDMASAAFLFGRRNRVFGCIASSSS